MKYFLMSQGGSEKGSQNTQDIFLLSGIFNSTNHQSSTVLLSSNIRVIINFPTLLFIHLFIIKAHMSTSAIMFVFSLNWSLIF